MRRDALTAVILLLLGLVSVGATEESGRPAPGPLKGLSVKTSILAGNAGRVSRKAVLVGPGGRCCAFVLGARRGKGKRVVSDVAAGRTYDDIEAKSLVFSPDGKRLAYVAEKGSKMVVVVDSKEGPAHEGVREDPPVFSFDSKRVAYVVKHGAKWIAVVDGHEGKGYDRIGRPAFSLDSKHVVYQAAQGLERFAVLDGRELKALDTRVAASLPLRWRVSVAQRGAKKAVALDGRPGAEYDDLRKLTFSDDGRRVAFAASRSGKWFVVVDGRDGKAYQDIERIVFSPGAQHLAYIARKGNRNYVVVLDGSEGPEYADMDTKENLLFSADGEHLAYIAEKPSRMRVMVLDGREGKEYGYIDRRGTALTSDGRRVAYLAKKTRDGDEFVVLNGKEIGPYDDVYPPSIALSPDGEHVACQVERGKKDLIVLDGRELPIPHDVVEGTLRSFFDAAGRFKVLIEHSGSILLVEVRPGGGRTSPTTSVPPWPTETRRTGGTGPPSRSKKEPAKPTTVAEFHGAVRQRDLRKIKAALDAAPELANATNDRGQASLHIVLEQACRSMARTMPGVPALPHPPTGPLGRGPQVGRSGAKQGEKDLEEWRAAIELLLSYKADPNIRDAHGKEPWQYVLPIAVLGYGNDMLRLLARHGARVPRHLLHASAGKPPSPKPAKTKTPPTPRVPEKRNRTPEEEARSRLGLAKAYRGSGKLGKARDILRAIIRDYPATKAAKAAQEELREAEKELKRSRGG